MSLGGIVLAVLGEILRGISTPEEYIVSIAHKNLKSELSVLVVDSNETAAWSIKMRIENMGHSVQWASTCKETLNKVAREVFDLIFLDLHLSDGDSIQLIPQIRKNLPEINVVTMTDISSRKLEQRARENRIIYFLLKPLIYLELGDIVKHISRGMLEKD